MKLTLHTSKGGDGDNGQLEECIPSLQHLLQVAVALRTTLCRNAVPVGATLSDVSGTCKFSYVKLRHELFGG